MELMTVKELAQMFKVSEMWVYDKVWKKELPYHRLGRSIRFNKAEIEEYLAKNKSSSD